MLISDVFPDGRSLMFFNALIQVSACVADIIRIAQITLKMVYNALLAHKRGFAFFWLDVRSDLSAFVHGMDIELSRKIGKDIHPMYKSLELQVRKLNMQKPAGK